MQAAVRSSQAAATDSRFDYDRVSFVINSGYAQGSHSSHTGDEWEPCLLAIKNTRPMTLCVGTLSPMIRGGGPRRGGGVL